MVSTERIGDITYDAARGSTTVEMDRYGQDIHKLVMEWLDEHGYVHYRWH